MKRDFALIHTFVETVRKKLKFVISKNLFFNDI